MGLFRIKRQEEDFEFGHIEGYMNADGEYGGEDEASLFSNRNAAKEALKNDRFNHTGDYRYDIEEV